MSTFDFERYYDLASELNESNDEAKKRSSISRSYYSAYIISRDVIIFNDCFIDSRCKEIMLSNNSIVHSELRRIFLEYHRTHNSKSSQFHKLNRLGKKIHDRLHDLRDYRNDADYGSDFNRIAYYSNLSLIFSRFIIDNIDDFII